MPNTDNTSTQKDNTQHVENTQMYTHRQHTPTHTDNIPTHTDTHNNMKHTYTKVTSSVAPEDEANKPYLPVVQGCRVRHSELNVVFLQTVL